MYSECKYDTKAKLAINLANLPFKSDEFYPISFDAEEPLILVFPKTQEAGLQPRNGVNIQVLKAEDVTQSNFHRATIYAIPATGHAGWVKNLFYAQAGDVTASLVVPALCTVLRVKVRGIKNVDTHTLEFRNQPVLADEPLARASVKQMTKCLQ